MTQGFTRLRQMAHSAVRLLFPYTCVGCGRLGEQFCARCAQAVEPSSLLRCARCGTPQRTITRGCPNCLPYGDAAPILTRAAALHTFPLREAIHAFKYEKQPELAPLLARYLVAVFAEEPWTTLPYPITAVVPVPLHEQRLAERGYNQSELLAASFCHVVDLPLQSNWIERTRDTPHQVGLDRSDRAKNVAGAFAATGSLHGENILLVDDVHTTGATIRACCMAARVAGANAVYSLTLAQPALEL